MDPLTDLRRMIDRARTSDGGFGPSPGADAEPEPTALVALALADADAVGWIAAHQLPDGSVPLERQPVVNDAATAIAAWSLTGTAASRVLDHLESSRTEPFADSDVVELDGSLRGWAYVRGTAAWVEPTARAVLALRRFRPDSTVLDESIAFLRDRACVGGGWNYGNRTVYGTDLEPYVHTTALACLALQGPADPDTLAEGLAVLERRWATEPGVMSLAVATCALSVVGHPSADLARSALAREITDTGAYDDTVALAWAALACSDRWSELVVP